MGAALNRVDGPLKVTGTAKYPAEFHLPNLAYTFLIMSPIAKGTITAIDSNAAGKSPGVLAAITHLNAPKPAEPPNDQKHVGIRIEEREPLADDKISYGGMNSLEADGKFDFKESNKVGFQSFGAQFCEVKIDPELPLVLVTRWVSVRIAGA
jgi:CO/xanthine dehydrogenase Mo-binding subunit